jgi:ABC-type transport system involved in multi-copper enzyme maturation permease subunit
VIRLELLKLLRSRRPVLAALSSLLFLTLMLVGFYTYARKRTHGEADFGYTFENESYFNGITFTVYSFYFGFLLVLPIFVATEGSTQIAGETSDRTLGLLLFRPVTKSRIFFTKVAVTAGYAMGLTGGFLALSLGVGLFAVGWGDLDLYPGVLQMTDRPQHLSQSEALWRFALIWPAASLGLWTTVSFAFLLSAYMKSAVNAAAVAVALYLVMHVVSGVHFFEELRPILFTSYLAYWRGLLQSDVEWALVGQDAAKLLGFALVFLALAHRRFRLREEF